MTFRVYTLNVVHFSAMNESRGDGLLAPRDIWVCTTYMFLATAMWIFNKKTVFYLPIPFAVMLVQTLATVLLLKLLRMGRFISMKPWSWQVFGTWVNTGFVWSIPLALNLRALTRLNPETLIVFRTATLIGVTFGDHLYGKKFTKREVLSIISILTGCSMYAINDAQYDGEGYMWASLYWAAMVVSTLYVKHSFTKNKDLNVWEKTVYLNATAVMPLAFFSLFFECITTSIRENLSYTGILWLLSSCVMGVALASASNKSRDFLSATAFDVMSTGSKFLTILVSGLIFESLYTPQSLVGLLIALAGGSLYSPIGAWVLECVGLKRWVEGNGGRDSLPIRSSSNWNTFGNEQTNRWPSEKAVTWASGLGGDDSPRRNG